MSSWKREYKNLIKKATYVDLTRWMIANQNKKDTQLYKAINTQRDNLIQVHRSKFRNIRPDSVKRPHGLKRNLIPTKRNQMIVAKPGYGTGYSKKTPHKKKKELSEKTKKLYARWRKPEKPGLESVVSYRRNPAGKGPRPRKRYK